MLTTIVLVLGIAALILHLWTAYIVPFMFRQPNAPVPPPAVISAIVAIVAIVLAVLLYFRVITLPPGS